MKKFVVLFFALLLCVSVLAASLQAVGYATADDPDPKPTVTVAPGGPDGLNTYPPTDDSNRKD